jgi:hypothetical protein
VGKVFFSLSSISTEDEYDLELVIPEYENKNSNLAKITGSFHFILSMFKYYRDLYTESENLLKEYETNLKKRNYFLDNMNEPLRNYNNKFDEISRSKAVEGDLASKGVTNISNQNQREVNNAKNLNSSESLKKNEKGAENDLNKNFPILNKFGAPSASDFQMADKIEAFVKNTFSKKIYNKIYFYIIDKPNIEWMGLIKFLLLLIVVLSFINLFDRSDFINLMLPIVILIIFYTSLNNNVVGYLNLFIIGIAGSFVYDILWFFLASSVKKSL